MYFPRPSLRPLVVFPDIYKFLSEFEGIGSVTGGVGVFGSAAAYALVWELGSLRLKKPGPRTIWGTNRNGEKMIMSSQAPEGYVGVISDQFWPIIEQEVGKLTFRGTDARSIRLELEVVVDNAMQRIARIISDAAPVDSGDLRSQIQYVDSGEISDLESDATLVL
jgi:hypothetical protein